MVVTYSDSKNRGCDLQPSFTGVDKSRTIRWAGHIKFRRQFIHIFMQKFCSEAYTASKFRVICSEDLLWEK